MTGRPSSDEPPRERSEFWNVDPLQIPSWAPPTHVMQMFRYAEEGSIRFLWVTGTNPAASLPELHRRPSQPDKPPPHVCPETVSPL